MRCNHESIAFIQQKRCFGYRMATLCQQQSKKLSATMLSPMLRNGLQQQFHKPRDTIILDIFFLYPHIILGQLRTLFTI